MSRTPAPGGEVELEFNRLRYAAQQCENIGATGIAMNIMEAVDKLYTKPAAGSGEAVPDVLHEAWLHEFDDDYDIYDIEGNPNPPCPTCRRVLIVAAPVPAGNEGQSDA